LFHYERRKAALIDLLGRELRRLDNRARFILMVVRDELKVRNVPKATLLQALWKNRFDLLSKSDVKKDDDVKAGPSVQRAWGRRGGRMDCRRVRRARAQEVAEEGQAAGEAAADSGSDGDDVFDGKAGETDFKGPAPSQKRMAAGYDYLLGMPLWSLTLERVE